MVLSLRYGIVRKGVSMSGGIRQGYPLAEMIQEKTALIFTVKQAVTVAIEKLPKASSASPAEPGAVLSVLSPPRSYTSSISYRYSGRSGGSYALMARFG